MKSRLQSSLFTTHMRGKWLNYVITSQETRILSNYTLCTANALCAPLMFALSSGGSGGNISHLRGSPGGRAERVNKGTRGGAGVGGRAWVAMQGHHPPPPTPGWERGLLLPGECWDAGRGRAAPPASPKSQVFGAPSPPRLRGRVSQEEPGNSGRPSLSPCDLARPRASQGEPLCPERGSKSRPARLLPGAERR